MFDNTLSFIKECYPSKERIALHEPVFIGNEKKYLNDCIDSTFVSSIGKYVDTFEEKLAEFIGARYAIAMVNGTAALHIALLLANVKADDEVLTQPLTFVATANAIRYLDAYPTFVDVDRDTFGLSPEKLKVFLRENVTSGKDGCSYNKTTGRRIKACMPMHTFGHSVKIDEIVHICNDHNIAVIEDSSESLGSRYKERHTGTFGTVGIFSFNGNKVITSGGGGALVTDNADIAMKARHLSTTARVQGELQHVHDMVAFNYRMPNINAALVCAQMENIELFIEQQRALASKYKDFFDLSDKISFLVEPEHAFSNYWLNTIMFSSHDQQQQFLQQANDSKILVRPVWRLLHKLDMYKDCFMTDLENAEWIEGRAVNIPSSVPLGQKVKDNV